MVKNINKFTQKENNGKYKLCAHYTEQPQIRVEASLNGGHRLRVIIVAAAAMANNGFVVVSAMCTLQYKETNKIPKMGGEQNDSGHSRPNIYYSWTVVARLIEYVHADFSPVTSPVFANLALFVSSAPLGGKPQAP